MKSNLKPTPLLFVLVLLAAGSLALSACSPQSAQAGGSAAAAQAQPLTPIRSGFSIEGRVVPQSQASLGFTTGGRLAEVLVKEGDLVEAGQALARLDNYAQSEAALAAAELQVVQAQQALDQLEKHATSAYSQALAAASASAAQARDAQYKLDAYSVPSALKDLTSAQAEAEMQAAYQAARSAYTQCTGSCSEAKRTLDTATANYNAAVRWLQLDTDVHTARIRYNQAAQEAADLKEGPDAADREAALAALKAAQAQLAAAQANQAAAELKAPLAGTVVTVKLMAGEQAAPNQLLIVIADFSQWMVETDNLTELDVVHLQPGQTARITADALPEAALTGTVESISSLFVEKRGDITYTVRLALDSPDPGLRWGMTTAVSFEK
jgi:HlyD family secretion protein